MFEPSEQIIEVIHTQNPFSIDISCNLRKFKHFWCSIQSFILKIVLHLVHYLSQYDSITEIINSFPIVVQAFEGRNLYNKVNKKDARYDDYPM